MSSSTLTVVPPEAEVPEQVEAPAETAVPKITERDRHAVQLILFSGGTIELQVLKAQYKRNTIRSLDDLQHLPAHAIEELRHLIATQLPDELRSLL